MTEQLTEYLRQIKSEATAALTDITSTAQLEQWRIKYLGRRGSLSSLLRKIKQLPPAERRSVGHQGNRLRQELTHLFEQKKNALPPATMPTKSTPASPAKSSTGHLHPLTLTMRKIQHIFSSLGFQLAEGPYVEEARYNFDLLNIPLEHPARAETDTFYLTNGHVLRTHTSPVQLRAVLENNLVPPFRIFSPGRCFRAERTDASHETTFYHVEGLEVGKDITIANFKGTVEALFSQFFNTDIATRLRPSFFPFVEPGFEVDIGCTFCRSKGCRVCKKSGWIEIMGAGMVHPNVLTNMNVDHRKYQGYAFGCSIDRLTMLRHNIDDIRLFWSGDLRFLRQFS